jgi:hypothetical protein
VPKEGGSKDQPFQGVVGGDQALRFGGDFVAIRFKRADAG